MNTKRLFTVSTLSVIAGTLSFGALTSLLVNLDFERGEVGWQNWGEGDIRQEYYGLEPHGGDNFLRLWSRSGWYQNFPTEGGKRYEVTAYVASAEKDALWGDAFAEVKIEWRNRTSDEDDMEVGTATSLKFDCDKKVGRTIQKDRWTRVTLPVVQAPENATHGRILCTIYTEGGELGGGCALFDDVNVIPMP